VKAARTFFLLGLVLCLGGYIFLVERHQMSSAERKEFEKRVFHVHADQVTGLRIRTAEYDVSLTRDQGEWWLRHPEGARAGEAMIKRTLSRLETLQRGELITPEDMRQRGVSLADFGLYVPKTVLVLQTSSGTREYRVGDPNPLRSSVYIKEENSQNVMLVSSDLLEILPEKVEVFYDPSLFPFEVEQVDSMSLVRDGETVRLRRISGGWRFSEPKAQPADSTQTEALLAKLLKATAEGYQNDPDETTDYGFEEPEERFRIWIPGRAAAHELVLGGDVVGEPELIYARLEGRDGLLKVSRGLRSLVRMPADGFRPSSLLPVDLIDQVAVIELEKEGGKVLMEKDAAENWVMREPLDRNVENEKLELLLQTWGRARVVGFDQDLEGRAVSHRIRFLDSSSRVLMEWELMQGENLPGRSLVRNMSTGEGVRVTPDLTPLTSPEPTAYLSRTFVNVPLQDVVRLGWIQGDRRLEFSTESGDAGWLLDGKEVPEAQVMQLLSFLLRLEAIDLRVVSPDERNEMGLNDPAMSISLGLAGERPANITLSVYPDTEEPVCYVVILGDELVYEVSSRQCTALQALFEPFLEEIKPESSDEETPAVP